MRFERDQAPRPRNRRVIRRRIFQAEPQKVAQCEGVRGTPRDAALRVDALEIANQEQPELDSRRQAWPAHRVGVERRTLRFGELVESMLAQQLIQSGVERVTRRRREIRRGDPHPRLSVAFPFAHRHGQSVVQESNPVLDSPRLVNDEH